MIDFIIIIILCILILIVLKLVMTEKVQELKKFKSREDLDEITKKLPDNITICNQILKMLNNEKVKVTEKQDYETNLYTIYNNEITITDKNEEYARLQTIAHECIHSTQNKKTLWFHFILSNIMIFYYIVIVILTLTGIIKNNMLQIVILLLLGLTHYAVRSYLETTAMTKAEYLAKEYLNEKKFLEKKEEKKLLDTYNKINKLGIPLTNYAEILKLFIKTIIYAIISLL